MSTPTTLNEKWTTTQEIIQHQWKYSSLFHSHNANTQKRKHCQKDMVALFEYVLILLFNFTIL